MFEKVKIPVMLCCNDYRNGIFEEKVSSIEIGDNLRLECGFAYWSPRMRVKGGKIFIARKAFPCLEYKEWYGNWCWDRAILYGKTVIELLNWLKQKDWFFAEEGETRMFQIWENKEKFFEDKHIRIFQK